MFDLVGLHVKDLRAKMKVTVLRRPGGKWVPEEIHLISTALNDSVCDDPGHPEYLLMNGERTRRQFEEVLGKSDFEHSVVTGMDNPALPFVPRFLQDI